MTVSFKVEGLKDLQAQLLELGAELGVRTLRSAARKAFAPIVEAARQLVPVDTGALRDSLKLTVQRPKSGATVVVVGMAVGGRTRTHKFGKSKVKEAVENPPARRWHFVELGTVNMAAHPFARPALDAGAPAVLEALKTELAKAIQRAIKKKARAAAKAGA